MDFENNKEDDVGFIVTKRPLCSAEQERRYHYKSKTGQASAGERHWAELAERERRTEEMIQRYENGQDIWTGEEYDTRSIDEGSIKEIEVSRSGPRIDSIVVEGPTKGREDQ